MGDMMISHGFCHPVEPFKGTQLIGYDIPNTLGIAIIHEGNPYQPV
jgi:hypothetical protein